MEVNALFSLIWKFHYLISFFIQLFCGNQVTFPYMVHATVVHPTVVHATVVHPTVAHVTVVHLMGDTLWWVTFQTGVIVYTALGTRMTLIATVSNYYLKDW